MRVKGVYLSGKICPFGVPQLGVTVKKMLKLEPVSWQKKCKGLKEWDPLELLKKSVKFRRSEQPCDPAL